MIIIIMLGGNMCGAISGKAKMLIIIAFILTLPPVSSTIKLSRNGTSTMTVLFLRRHNLDASECDFVIKQAEKALRLGGMLSDNLKFSWINVDSCEFSSTKHQFEPVVQAAKAYYEMNIDAIIGPHCSTGMITTGQMASQLNIPIIGYDSVHSDLYDKTIYTTLARVSVTSTTLGQAIAKLSRHFGWNKVGIIIDDSDQLVQFFYSGIQEALAQANIKSVVAKINKKAITAQDLQFIKDNARNLGIAQLMEEFTKANMSNSAFVFLLPDFDGTFDGVLRFSQLAKQAFKRSLAVTPKGLDSHSRTIFEKIMADSGLILKVRDVEAIDSKINIYNAFYLYMKTVNQLFLDSTYNQSLFDGREIIARMAHQFFDGITSRIWMGERADRIPEYTVRTLIDEKVEEVMEINVALTCKKSVKNCSSVDKNSEIVLQTKLIKEDFKTPKDTPECGFKGKDCDEETSLLFYIGSTWFFIFLILIIVCVFCGSCVYRKVQNVTLIRMPWRIKRGAILAGKTTSRISLQSVQTTKSAAIHDPRTCNTGVLKNIRHDNLNIFVGLSFNESNGTEQELITIWQKGTRGSLEEIIFNADLQLDNTFQFSFIKNIIDGLEYVHKSQLVANGAMDISNCEVDSHWVVKLSNFGLQPLLCDLTEHNEIVFEQLPATKLLRLAPEIIKERALSLPTEATKEGDIYSFAVIVYQILFRFEPFEYGLVSAEDILEHVLNEGMSVSPKFPKSADFDPKLLSLLKTCWSEEPQMRPAIRDIKQIVGGLSKTKGSLMDHLITMMDKYAGNLEKLVRDRTALLEEAQERADKLLYEMIPKSVAMELKAGRQVKPKFFTSATVFFSDIVQFTKLCSESSPLQIVNFLNSLYSKFDEVIGNHDTYKVETIGDAYLVVSGVPKTNGISHAWHICDMALGFCDIVSGFKLDHRKDKNLEIRCGIHSGPVAAGVIGLTAPRYCLFGDTVNTASRMESSSAAMKIQISETTRELLDKYNDQFETVERGEIDIKGKGMMKTYWLSRTTIK